MENTICMDKVIGSLCSNHGTADVIIMNGFHVTGKVIERDDKSILIEAGGNKQLVMLHAVSTIVPLGVKDTEA